MYNHLKYIGFIAITFAIASAHAAKTCNGGTMITANDNTQYCKSPTTLNWWSAYTWCESNGRQLVSFETVCGATGTNNNCVSTKFSGMTDKFWINKLKPASWGFFYQNSTSLNVWGRHDDTACYALCE